MRDRRRVGRAQEHVRRLDVAVDDPSPVRGLQGIGDLGTEPGGRLWRQCTVAGEVCRQVAAVDVLGGDVGDAGLHAVVEDRHDVLGVDPGQGPCLGIESSSEDRIRGQVGPHQLQGHGSVQHRVRGEMHHSHASAAESSTDDIASEAVALGGQMHAALLLVGIGIGQRIASNTCGRCPHTSHVAHGVKGSKPCAPPNDTSTCSFRVP